MVSEMIEVGLCYVRCINHEFKLSAHFILLVRMFQLCGIVSILSSRALNSNK